MSFPNKNKKGLSWPPNPDEAEAPIVERKERKKPKRSAPVVVRKTKRKKKQPVEKVLAPEKCSEKTAHKDQVWDPAAQAFVDLRSPDSAEDPVPLSPGERAAAREVFVAEKKKVKHRSKRARVSRKKKLDMPDRLSGKKPKRADSLSMQNINWHGALGWLLVSFSWGFFITYLYLWR